MHRLGDVLKQLLYEHDLDETTLSELTGVAKANISRLKNNAASNPTYASLKPIADYFAISVSQLLGEEPLDSKKSRKAPILPLESVSAWLKGAKGVADSLITQLPLSEKAFAYRIEEATLGPLFPKGAVVLCDNTRPFQDGDYVLAQNLIETALVLMRLVIEQERYYLVSLRGIGEAKEVNPANLLAYVVEVRYQLA